MPKKSITTQRIVKIAMFTVLTVLGAFIRIPMPMSGVMLTFQCFFCILAGLFLGAFDGMASQAVYVLMGIIGLPVFSQGGGLMYVFQPSFGYIISLPLGAFIAGFLRARFKTLSVIKLFFSCFFGLSAIYLVGVPYQFFILWLYSGMTASAAAMTLITLPFLFLKDAALVYLICLLYPRMHTMIGAGT